MDSNQIKYPGIVVQLSNEDSNAFLIISRVRLAMRRAGVPTKEIDKFTAEAKSGGYGNMLSTCEEWVTVE
jgi:hypothetical protein